MGLQKYRADEAKSGVSHWETVATAVVTYPSDGADGACDVEVQIGQAEDGWYVRTRDDAGGSDDAGDTAYATEAEAREAAEDLAASLDEGFGLSAEAYLRARTEGERGDTDPAGAWCVYWTSACEEDEGPRERYATREQAEAATALANEDLRRSHPGTLLCGFAVAHLDDGEWRVIAEQA
jgi:hypothetical protein